MNNRIVLLILIAFLYNSHSFAHSLNCDVYKVVIYSLYAKENTLNTIHYEENPIKIDAIKSATDLRTIEHILYVDRDLEIINPRWFLKWSYGIVRRNKLKILSFVSSKDTFFTCKFSNNHCIKVVDRIEAEKLNYMKMQYCEISDKHLSVERFSFSNIIFSKDYHTALVNVTVHRRNSSNSGYSVLLAKKGERWMIVDSTYGFD